ncbi:9724_t:CDS:2 [Entrophospora sp. SA101]|nr:13074_t:CDS:2 [Entrophospora sp. SA101]CAJ0635517.1 9724_t:CDS:2 [Entrophospora sp. SA101]CAJ0846729.1 4319_t:CDS:2 [Entrophospora sp. SA101]CAJ0903795.1 9923_t:CDS:2 [Entrophospora sp. SA101]
MENNRTNITKLLNFLNPNKKSSSVSPQQSYNLDYEWSAAISALDLSASMQRRSSVSNCHENSKKRLLKAKKAEYEEKMQAFDELISKRRGNNLRSTLAYDVASY